MYNEKIYLTPQDILNKDFKRDPMGYRPQEVDKYLDMVIRDYTEFLRTIKKLEQDNVDLINDNRKLQAEYRKLKASIEASSSEGHNSGSSDVLRRLSNLEKIVYGKE
jgi:DivIVA domain-containing protein